MEPIAIGILERKLFSGKRFDSMLDWCEERREREIFIQVDCMYTSPNGSRNRIEIQGRVLNTRKTLFLKRIALEIENFESPLQALGIEPIITIGGENSKTTDLSIKQAEVFHLIKRELHEDLFFDGDQLIEAVEFLEKSGAPETYQIRIWGKTFKHGNPIYLKGRYVSSRIEFPNIELMELITTSEEDGKRGTIVTIGSREFSSIRLVQRSTGFAKPDFIARKIHLRPAYEKEIKRFDQIVQLNNLTVAYDKKPVFEDVSFTLNSGEILGVIGESGAGKTTMIKALIREVHPRSGTATIAGISSDNINEIKPLLGFVPQDLSYIYDTFTPIENIVIFGKNYGIPEDRLIERGKRLLRDFGIFEKGNDPVNTLSGGQQRRVSVAIALAHYPKLLILDEPTSGLDPDRRTEFWRYLDKVNREYGTTIICVSHYPEECEFCDKVAVFIKEKSMIAFGSPKSLKESLPGHGFAVGVFLKHVYPEAVNILTELPDVRYVLQRGELLKIFSHENLEKITESVVKELESNKIPLKTVIPYMSIDMTDYFISVSRGMLGE